MSFASTQNRSMHRDIVTQCKRTLLEAVVVQLGCSYRQHITHFVLSVVITRQRNMDAFQFISISLGYYVVNRPDVVISQWTGRKSALNVPICHMTIENLCKCSNYVGPLAINVYCLGRITLVPQQEASDLTIMQ